MNQFFKFKQKGIKIFAIYFITGVIIIGSLVLLGWQLNIELFKRLLPFLVAMNPLTAFLFIIISISFLFITSKNKYQKKVSRFLLLFIQAICVVVLLDRYFKFNFNIDHIFFSDKIAEEYRLGLLNSMSSNTALTFIFSALALLLLKYKNRMLWVPYQILAILSFSFAFFSLLSYVYNAPEFIILWKHIPMALHTSICFIFISFSILLIKPNVGIVKEFTGNLAGRSFGLILLISAFAIPFILGLIRIYTLKANIFSTELSISLLVLIFIITFSSMVILKVIGINRKDLLRKANEDKFKSLIESAPDAIVIVDVNKIIQLVNIQTEIMFGYDRINMIGTHVNFIIPSVTFNSKRFNKNSLSEGNDFLSTKEYKAIKNGGESFPVEIRISPLKADQEILTSISIRDITMRQFIEEINWKNQEIFRALVTNVVGYAIIMLDLEGNILTWNKGAEFIKGYKGDEVVGKNISIFYLDEEKNISQQMLEMAKENGELEFEGWRVKKDGSIFWADIILKVLYGKNGLITGYATITRDFTDKKKLQDTLFNFNEELKNKVREKTKEIQTTSEQLRSLSAHLQTAIEEERKSIAREMHDELGQMITGLRMDVVWLRKKISSTDDAIINRFERSLDLLNDIKQSMRRITMDLHPAILNDLGLITALKVYAQEFESRSGIKVIFTADSFDDAESKFSPEISIGFYRIFQESLNNVVKHAEANEVIATLIKQHSNLEFRIQDDGKGFNMDDVIHKKSLGLISIRERMYMIDGKYQIISSPGNGTLITLTAPIIN